MAEHMIELEIALQELLALVMQMQLPEGVEVEQIEVGVSKARKALGRRVVGMDC